MSSHNDKHSGKKCDSHHCDCDKSSSDDLLNALLLYQLLHQNEKNKPTYSSSRRSTTDWDAIREKEKKDRIVPPDLPAEERYVKAKSIYTTELVCSILAVLLVLAVVVGFNLILLAACEGQFALIAIISLVIGFFIPLGMYHTVAPNVRQTHQQLIECRNAYYASASREEIRALRKRTIRKTVKGWLIAIFIFGILFALAWRMVD